MDIENELLSPSEPTRRSALARRWRRAKPILRILGKYGAGVISFSALCISSLTLYWAQHQVDDLKVILQQKGLGLFLKDLDSASKFDVNLAVDGTFINGGNRSVVVTSAKFVMDRVEYGTLSCKPRTEHDLTPTMPISSVSVELSAFVLKPGEIVTKSLSIKSGDTHLPVWGPQTDYFIACLIFFGATPEKATSTNLAWQTGRLHFRTEGEHDVVSVDWNYLIDGNRPAQLFR